MHRVSIATCAVWLVAGCAGGDDSIIGKGSDRLLSSVQARVFGFESPTSDWSASSGSLSSSNVASKGSKALGVVPSGWTEVSSIKLSSLDDVTSTVSFDLRMPQRPSWGEARVILVAPSLDMWWTDLGQKSLATLAVGSYTKVSFPLSSALVNKLSGVYNDLTVKIVINAPALSSPYLVDNLVLTNTVGPLPPPPAETVMFSVKVPQGQTTQDVFVSTTDHLTVQSQTKAGTSGTPWMTNFGPFTTYFGAQSSARADVFSRGPIQLQSQVKIYGDVTTAAASIGKQQPVQIYGTEKVQTNIPSRLIEWPVVFPSPHGDAYYNAAPSGMVERTLAPGSYGELNLGARNSLNLSTGVYYFQTFNTEPQARVRLDTDDGPVIVYVRQKLRRGSVDCRHGAGRGVGAERR